MANQAEPVAQPVAMGGAFVEDVEAQARFVAHKRYLAWRRRLLPGGPAGPSASAILRVVKSSRCRCGSLS